MEEKLGLENERESRTSQVGAPSDGPNLSQDNPRDIDVVGNSGSGQGEAWTRLSSFQFEDKDLAFLFTGIHEIKLRASEFKESSKLLPSLPVASPTFPCFY